MHMYGKRGTVHTHCALKLTVLVAKFYNFTFKKIDTLIVLSPIMK